MHVHMKLDTFELSRFWDIIHKYHISVMWLLFLVLQLAP